jgi:DNA-3-methyladenine glycosylase II
MKITYHLEHPDIVFLSQNDPKLERLFNHVGTLTIEILQPAFPFLIYTIIGQQISTKVVEILYQRLHNLVGELTPENVLEKPFEAYVTLGLSKRKIETMMTMAEAALNGAFVPTVFNHASPQKITQHLTQFKGIGPWTADMFIMFSLGHMDHFSTLDLGLVKAYQKLYGEAPLAAIEKDAQNWRPLRSVVAHYLWAYWDN